VAHEFQKLLFGFPRDPFNSLDILQMWLLCQRSAGQPDGSAGEREEVDRCAAPLRWGEGLVEGQEVGERVVSCKRRQLIITRYVNDLLAGTGLCYGGQQACEHRVDENEPRTRSSISRATRDE
jgi:hypothetical protein